MFASAQLKYDPTKQYHPFININPSMPPYVTRLQGLNQAVEQYKAYICGLLANKVQKYAGQNALRMTLFNLAGENNFNNEYFDRMCNMSVDAVAYLMERSRDSVDVALEKATETVCEYFAAANARTYGVLGNYIDDPHVRGVVQETIREFDTIVNELAQFRAQKTNGGTGMGMVQNGFAQPSFNSQSQFSGNGGSSFAAGLTSSNQVSSNFSTTVPAAAAPDSNSGFSQWPGTTAPTPVPQSQQQQFDPVTEVVEAQHLPAHTGNWVPNFAEEPYFYAYDPREWNAQLTVLDSGATIPDYTRKSDQEKMDYNQHATPLVLGKIPAFLDITQSARTMQKISAGIQQLNGETQESDDQDVTTVKTMVAQDWAFANSEAGAWLEASLKRLQVEPGENGLPNVYRVYARVVDAVITATDKTDVIKSLVKCESFVGLRDKMEALGGEMPGALFNVINRRLTDMVNRKLRLVLSLRKIQIENFYDDIGELPEYLDNKYGSVVKGGFLRGQKHDIAVTLQTLTEGMADAEAAVAMAGMKFPEDKKPVITFVAANYSLTYLDCSSWDLSMEFGDDLPVKLSQECTPLFYQLVKGAFDDALQFEGNGDMSNAVARVMLRTNDDRVFECTMGNLADEAFLITLIK